MAVRFERTIAGDVAYLEGRRDGPVLMWGPGSRVRFGYNRAGGALTLVTNPDRFGGTPTTSKQFRTFVARFVDEGSSRRRGGLAGTRVRDAAAWATDHVERAVAVKATGEFGVIAGSSGHHGVMVRVTGAGGRLNRHQEFQPKELRLLPRRR
jgi:hypothetical protein